MYHCGMDNMMTAYKPGSGTIKAIKALAEKLDFPVGRSMNEWSEELAERNQLEHSLNFYDSLIGEDEKFVLMGVMVRAANERLRSFGFCDAWARLEQRLIWDFHIHEFTIRKWARTGSDSLDCSLTINPEMKALWDRRTTGRKRILFVCTVNVMRSATAHQIYSNDLRFQVRSAGTHHSAGTVLSKELLDWAEMVVVMEERHLNFIRKTYPAIFKGKNIVCLDVPDNYDYMQAELVALLRDRFEEFVWSFMLKS